MLIKGKDRDTEITFETCADLGFWVLPLSICFIHMPKVGSLAGGLEFILRILCFQFSWEIWKWEHEITDVENSIEELFDE